MGYLEDNYNKIFKKYNNDDLIKDWNNFKNGNGNLYKFLNHFFEELIFESCGKKTKISPMDVLKDNDKINEIFEYIKTKPNFYKGSDISNLKSYFRNAVGWVRKVANFPAKTARSIYNRYKDNFDIQQLNILDTSCGFGSRMSATLVDDNNYFGIEPNNRLYHQLCLCVDFLINNNLTNGNSCIYCNGSENYIEELDNKMHISFTSPPYFDLEYYSNDKYESTKNLDNYDNWIEYFVKPTIGNTYSYLIVGGYALINAKNISSKHKIYDDFFNIFDTNDFFRFVEEIDMKIIKKNYDMAENIGKISNVEKIMCFQKIK